MFCYTHHSFCKVSVHIHWYIYVHIQDGPPKIAKLRYKLSGWTMVYECLWQIQLQLRGFNFMHHPVDIREIEGLKHENCTMTISAMWNRILTRALVQEVKLFYSIMSVFRICDNSEILSLQVLLLKVALKFQISIAFSFLSFLGPCQHIVLSQPAVCFTQGSI